MKHTVDARGLACPQPVINTKNALGSYDEVLTIVDNKTALENITRMARNTGCTVSYEQKPDGFYITLKKTVTAASTDPAQGAAIEHSCPATGPRVLVLSQDVMGRGDDALGQLLIKSFFHTLAETSPAPEVIVFFNSGVKLLVSGSPVLEDVRSLEKNGVRILACGTCLDFFNLKSSLAAGAISNMYEIKELMLTASSTVNI